MANRAIRGREIDAYYCVRMPDTWTPIFDLSTPEKVAKYTRNTEAEIDRALRGVRARRVSRHMFPRTPAIFTDLIAGPIYERVRRTKHLHVEDGCVGCGLCARKCPVQAIEMRNGRPVWVREQVRHVPRLPAPLPEIRHPVRPADAEARAVHQPQCEGMKRWTI